MRYADAGQAFRYSLTLLHRPLTADEQATTGLPERARPTAVAVHGAVAGALIASWSKAEAVLSYPAHQIADVLGLEKFADSEGEASEVGNANRGRQARHRIMRALDELEARGAIRMQRVPKPLGREYQAERILIALPFPPDEWEDPTYRHRVADGEDVETSAPAQPVDVETPAADPEPGTVETPSEPVTRTETSVTGTETGVTRSVTGVTSCVTGVTRSLTSNEKQHEKQNEKSSKQASETNADEREPVTACSLADDPRPKANPQTARTSERVSDTPKANTGKQPETDERAQTLAGLIPRKVAERESGGAIELARKVLNRTDAKHAEARDRLIAFLDDGALDELRTLLTAKAPTVPSTVTSLHGLLLAWCRDLPERPTYSRADYAYGFAFRDALKDAELAGKGGYMTPNMISQAARVVLDAGHDPAVDPDGFLAVLAATLLPHANPRHLYSPDPLLALQGYAGDVEPLPFTMPEHDRPDDYAYAQLAHVGLSGHDPRAKGWRS